MTMNGLDTVADQLKAAAEQYGNEAAELEQQAKTLRDKQARVAQAVVALTGAPPKPERKSGTPRAYRHFTAEDDSYLREHWGTMQPAHIAKHLGRRNQTITDRATRLGLRATA